MTEPQRFRKQPIEIEARQFVTDDDGQSIAAWVRSYHGDDSAFWFAKGDLDYDLHATAVVIHTLEGAMTASPGDWIIRGVQGEFYPCKPDIFAATYSAPETAKAPAAGADQQRNDAIDAALLDIVGLTDATSKIRFGTLRIELYPGGAELRADVSVSLTSEQARSIIEATS